MIKTKISEICYIKTGYTLRTSLKNEPNGNVRVIQMRDLIKDHTEISDNPFLMELKEKNNGFNHILKKGDILFISKGETNRSIVFDKPYTAIASSAFLVISKKENVEYDPYFLSWFINSDFSERFIKSKRTGSTTPLVLLESFIEMPVILPSLEKQKKGSFIYELYKQQIEMEKELKKLRSKYMEGVLQNIIS